MRHGFDQLHVEGDPHTRGLWTEPPQISVVVAAAVTQAKSIPIEGEPGDDHGVHVTGVHRPPASWLRGPVARGYQRLIRVEFPRMHQPSLDVRDRHPSSLAGQTLHDAVGRNLSSER